MRWPAVEPTMQSKRVMATMSMMVRTPRPSAPTIQPARRAARSRCWRSTRCPSCASGAAPAAGSCCRRAPARHQEAAQAARAPAPAPGRRRTSARRRNICGPPVRRPRPGRGGAGRVGARGVAAHVGAALFLGHRHADGQAGFLRIGHVARVVDGAGGSSAPTARPARACVRSAGTAAKVMVTGQPWPASTWSAVNMRAARATWARGAGSA